MTTDQKWWSENTVAVVTGSSRGVGYELVRAFAAQGLTAVLTARDTGRGQAAVDALKATGLKSVWFHPLDVVSSESVQELAKWLKSQFGGIDILVNNAAVTSGSAPGADGTIIDYENAMEIVDTNYYGVKNVTESLLPLMRPSPAGARIVNVTSRAGLYERLNSESLRQTFRDECCYSKELVDSLAEKYLEDVKTGRYAEEGWFQEGGVGSPMYMESKLFLNVYSIVIAKSLAKSQPEGHRILVTTFCPGATETDMYRRFIVLARKKKEFVMPAGFHVKSLEEGGDTGVWLALMPKEELEQKTGKFFGERKEYPFGWKNPPF